MEFIKTEFDGLIVVKPRVFGDQRGYFLETFNNAKFVEGGIDYDFVQDNQSKSRKGVLRGLHYQNPPHAQGKLVSVVLGSVLDVVVDIRKSSKTYGGVFSIKLDAIEKTMLFVPPGFAHGFATLEDDTIFSYKCTENYHPEAENTLMWNDPTLKINWGIDNPIISEKDQVGIYFDALNTPFE